jgi:hypothetical protein
MYLLSLGYGAGLLLASPFSSFSPPRENTPAYAEVFFVVQHCEGSYNFDYD